MAIQSNGPDISTLLNGWQMPPPGPQSQSLGHVPENLLDGWKLPDPPKPSDMALQGPPLMVRDSRLTEIPNRFQSSGKLSIDGDIVTQNIGRHTAEYSLSQLSAHAKDPEYFSLSVNLEQTKGNVRDALHLYNAPNLSTPSTLTDLGSQGKVPYEESTLIHYSSIQ